MVSGILNINKPSGISSFQVVANVRRLTRNRKVGHGGTLDPAAVGVLPVFLNHATRLVEYFMHTSKTYCARIVLGATTDTYDTEGKVLTTADPSGVTREQVELALNSFRGEIEQIPPMHSALKRQGQRLYILARAGVEVERSPRLVKIYDIQLLDWQPPAVVIQVECGKGTYMRSIAQELGRLLGCGAYQDRLVRVQDGPFDIEDSLTLEELELACEHGYWSDLVFPMDEVLLNWQAVILGRAGQKALLEGQALTLKPVRRPGPPPNGSPFCRVYSGEGDLVAVARLDPYTGLCQPQKVLYP
ncbi:MAG: tRNA pseudouridine(55) synthase TruB [Dehalococcoidia bacterium]|nr:tRNA pseudouridine(55) synthase TruB [Dehalococcoidia bacterium]